MKDLLDVAQGKLYAHQSLRRSKSCHLAGVPAKASEDRGQVALAEVELLGPLHSEVQRSKHPPLA